VRRLPLILVLVHSAVVLLVAGGVYALLARGYHEAVQLWALAAIVDLPAVALVAVIERWAQAWLDGAGEVARWVWFPAATHLLVGGLWWWLVGVVIARLSARLKVGASGE
jgi:hypothetical protein